MKHLICRSSLLTHLSHASLKKALEYYSFLLILEDAKMLTCVRHYNDKKYMIEDGILLQQNLGGSFAEHPVASVSIL